MTCPLFLSLSPTFKRKYAKKEISYFTSLGRSCPWSSVLKTSGTVFSHTELLAGKAFCRVNLGEKCAEAGIQRGQYGLMATYGNFRNSNRNFWSNGVGNMEKPSRENNFVTF